MGFKKDLIADLKDDYGVIFENGTMSLKERGGKVNNYVTDEEVLVLSNFPLGTKANEHGISKNTVRSTISKCAYLTTNAYKEEMTYREGEMLLNVKVVFLLDHKNGYIELVLFSKKLDYSVSLLVRSDKNHMQIGSVTG